jgi:hypothetical protein
MADGDITRYMRPRLDGQTNNPVPPDLLPLPPELAGLPQAIPMDPPARIDLMVARNRDSQDVSEEPSRDSRSGDASSLICDEELDAASDADSNASYTGSLSEHSSAAAPVAPVHERPRRVRAPIGVVTTTVYEELSIRPVRQPEPAPVAGGDPGPPPPPPVAAKPKERLVRNYLFASNWMRYYGDTNVLYTTYKAELYS